MARKSAKPKEGEGDPWVVKPGSKLDLAAVDPRSTPGVASREAAEAEVESLVEPLAELQERLWAEREQSLLVVLQAIDAGGKDGAIKHIFRSFNPAGCRVASFKAPSEEELAHDFLWRVHRVTPAKGEAVVFNRSHYEDVLIVRVHEWVAEDVWRRRYGLINDFEATLAAAGTRIVKVMLHISKEEQAERFRDRLEDPTKRWKFRAGDIDERKRWDDYQAAFEDAIAATSTELAPWFVIPSDRKWYRNWAISRILAETLEDMDPQYPEPEPYTGVIE